MDLAELLDPELREAFVARPAFDNSDPAAFREKVRALLARNAVPPRESVARRDLSVPRPGDGGPVAVRIYEPRERSGPLPGILHVHGGGFTAGDLDSFAAISEGWVESIGAVVASVDYRLAPEHPFPAASEDCYAALLWFVAFSAELGVDEDRIALVGESAGGGLAAALALMARDRGEVQAAFQMLLCACLDDRLTTPSSRAITDARTWSRRSAQNGWNAYLGSGRGDEVSPYAAPARATDLSGLPPTYVAVGQYDLLVDENVDYARRLIEARVPTELHVYPGGFHRFEYSVPTARISIQAVADHENALRRALHPRKIAGSAEENTRAAASR